MCAAVALRQCAYTLHIFHKKKIPLKQIITAYYKQIIHGAMLLILCYAFYF